MTAPTDNAPKPIWSGSFMLGNVELKCHVLDNGVRIIEADSLEKLLYSGEGNNATEAEIIQFANWQKGIT